MSVPPPRQSDFDDVPTGEYDREVWLSTARDIYGLDESVLAEKPTAWIVRRCQEEPSRYYHA
jgi:hypothetical protein